MLKDLLRARLCSGMLVAGVLVSMSGVLPSCSDGYEWGAGQACVVGTEYL